MGVYTVENRDLDISLMCDRALLALKSIKGKYESRVAYYSEDMRQELIESQQIVNEMNTALDEGQFIIYIQPQFNYTTNRLHGGEALVRWKHPSKGIIMPGKFVPIFEKNGFITHLDQFVWEEVCKLQRKWLDEGREVVPVSVNVSRTDIASLRLVDHFVKLVGKYDLPTELLRIEITESAYMDNPSQMIETVSRLREAGFSVEMDDFGSGYSSLNTLKELLRGLSLYGIVSMLIIYIKNENKKAIVSLPFSIVTIWQECRKRRKYLKLSYQDVQQA